MTDYAMEPFETVQMLGRWPVMLPAYRVEHCKAQPNWEEGRLLSMRAHLKPGMVLYDVGAEHGDLSALYGTWVRGQRVTLPLSSDNIIPMDRGMAERNGWDEQPDGSWERTETLPGGLPTAGGVVLVEGSDKFWPVIKATFEANALTPLACWAGFASDMDSPESERGPGWADPSWTVDGEWPSWAQGEAAAHHGFKSLVESKQTIPNMTFDTMALNGAPVPDALTIDVEGAELRVLHGADEILREYRPIVWVSIHPTLIAHDYPESGVLGTGDPDHERQRVIDFMTSVGYRSQHLETNHEEHHVFWPEERTDFDPWLDVEHLRP